MTQSDEIFGDLSEDSLVSMGILKLENVLNQVVSIWVFNEVWHVLNDVVCELQLLSLSTFFEASLHNTATVFVGADVYTLHHTRIEDELSV